MRDSDGASEGLRTSLAWRIALARGPARVIPAFGGSTLRLSVISFSPRAHTNNSTLYARLEDPDVPQMIARDRGCTEKQRITSGVYCMFVTEGMVTITLCCSARDAHFVSQMVTWPLVTCQLSTQLKSSRQPQSVGDRNYKDNGERR